MTLAVTDEHLQLAESVRALAARLCPPGFARAAADSADAGTASYRDALAPGLAEQGLLGLHVPEADGGQGFGLPELTVAIEDLGRALVPGGFVPTVLASAVLIAGGLTGKLVSSLADGSATAAVALTAELDAEPGTDDALVVSGSASLVLGAPDADLVLVPVWPAPDTVWVALDAADLKITPVDGLDLTRQLARVEADAVVVPQSRQLHGRIWTDFQLVRQLAAVILGAEAVGVAGWAVHTAAEYAKIRHQFGRPIGQFQAVKHRCARMLVAVEQAAAAVWDAARALDESASTDTGHEFAAATAAALAADAAVSCTHECIQVLGGIGFTWEHDAHLYYRRALTVQALLASAAGSMTWAERAADLAIGGFTRPVRLELPGGGEDLRAAIRAELAEITPLAGKERNAALAAGGWVMPHLPKPWGRAAGALEQLVIDEELRAASIQVPGLAIGGVGRARPDPVRHAGTAAAVPAGHPPAGLPVVSALQRAGRRIRPGRPDHQGGAHGRRLEDHRPEDLDVTGQARGVGHLHRPHRSGAAQARRHQLLPGRHALAWDRCQATARDHRGLDLQPGVPGRRVRPRRVRRGRDQQGLADRQDDAR